jgi:hypothetical protein
MSIRKMACLVIALLGVGNGALAATSRLEAYARCGSIEDLKKGNTSAQATVPNAPGDTRAIAEASPGTLNASAVAWGVSAYPNDSLLCSSYAFGETADSIYIDAPISGFGTATFHLHVSGLVDATSSRDSSVYATASSTYSFEFNGASYDGSIGEMSRFGQESRSVEGVWSGMNGDGSELTLTARVLFDSWVPLRISAFVDAKTFDYGALSGYFAAGSANGFADFLHTFEFVGISNLVDANGVPTEFTAIGESGRDYRIAAPGAGPVDVPVVAAVPEPETWALMFAGLAFAGAVARRRQRSVERPTLDVTALG